MRVAQRQTALKFQINHNYSWRTFYKERLKRTEKELEKASSDQAESLNRQIDYDKRMALYYTLGSQEAWVTLKNQQAIDTEKEQGINKQIDANESEILELEYKKYKVKNEITRRIADLKHYDGDTVGQMKDDKNVDDFRADEVSDEFNSVSTKFSKGNQYVQAAAPIKVLALTESRNDSFESGGRQKKSKIQEKKKIKAGNSGKDLSNFGKDKVF